MKNTKVWQAAENFKIACKKYGFAETAPNTKEWGLLKRLVFEAEDFTPVVIDIYVEGVAKYYAANNYTAPTITSMYRQRHDIYTAIELKVKKEIK